MYHMLLLASHFDVLIDTCMYEVKTAKTEGVYVSNKAVIFDKAALNR